ncbi:hypothetical protein E4T56_gene20422 [Termitomyces sp. T112]|nr:hypothetical protein E4T56_gene20422 [Termitomyces sp. T112]
MFQAKPITFQLESSQVASTASYLQSIAFDHYTVLLQFNSNNPMLFNWLTFTQEFSNNFIDESLAVLAPQHLQCLPTPILLKLFDGDPTSAGDITHYVEMIMTFTNGQCQYL